MPLDPKDIKAGDQVFISYLAWGRMPTLHKITVKSIGAKRLTSKNHGVHDVAKTSFYATQREATDHLRKLYVAKLEESRREAKTWEERIAEIDAAIIDGALESEIA